MAGPPHDDRSRSFRFPWRSATRIRRDIDDEVRFHLDMRTAELIAAGMDEHDARREATREFGDIERTGTIAEPWTKAVSGAIAVRTCSPSCAMI